MLNIMMAVLLAAAGTATAAGPTETVQTAVQQVFSSQGGPAVKTLSTAERRADVRKITETLFDFTDMSERSLGSAWTQASPAQQQEFIRLFSTLIANAYLSRIEQYAGEPITYVSEKIDGDEASVQSRVVTPKGSDIGLEYRLYRADSRWAVYDIYVEGISLVGSYKAQFNRILQRGSFADLLKQLRQKVGS
ncbi:MAG: ABC transporter substrate-binding protein [Candidatus Rokubacteria bacterium]|nr:ABC transporter substrate-binding protein [Candidatus Rokubacteria bacterium]